jgi:hypothetical protein
VGLRGKQDALCPAQLLGEARGQTLQSALVNKYLQRLWQPVGLSGCHYQRGRGGELSQRISRHMAARCEINSTA